MVGMQCIETKNAFSEHNDGISDEIVSRLEYSNSEAVAYSHKLPTVNFDNSYLLPKLSRIKVSFSEHGPI
jgi:hypothetical protein